ncbi:hypothetical protein Csa_015316 [Cucumis sativus]|nr:hypothetical protein Csa_020774 [Cucumis sativus]KAE8649131.1 hypothetical protein Csa_015316 [Cucumis sativus]
MAADGCSDVRLGLDGTERKREDGDGRRRLLCERMGRLAAAERKWKSRRTAEEGNRGGGCWATTQIWTGQRRKSNDAVLLRERRWRRQIGRSASVGETRR